MTSLTARVRALHSDYDQIVAAVPEGASVLDLGCGGGELLQRLQQERHVRGAGVEIDQEAVVECIHKGLSVFQGNIDEGLADYGDASYDYVILNQTLQVIRRPDFVIEEMLRVGRRGIVSFPNFGSWRVRWQLLARGRMPRTLKLPFAWYNTPNIHLLTIRDFIDFCRSKKIDVERSIYMAQNGQRRRVIGPACANWRADEGLFIITRMAGSKA